MCVQNEDKAFVVKQSLVVDDQSTACAAMLCVTLIREPHTPVVNQKREKDPGRACISFKLVVVSVLKLDDIYIIFTCVVVAIARRLVYIGDCVEPMESFGSFTPQRAGKRSVHAF